MKQKFKQTEIGMIPEDWEVKELSELLQNKGYIRGPFGSALRRPELKSDGIPVYEQANAIYNHREFRFFIDEEKYKEMKRFTVEENDLIISCSGTFGKISIIKKEDSKGIISQALLILRPDTNKVNPNFLKYFFTSDKGFQAIASRSLGSVQVNIAKREVIEKIELAVPENMDEQEAIVKILSSLDSKIELNQQMNKTLEEISRAIFKRWFIDFEFPNEKGKPYRSSGGEIVESEFGEIPKGWKVGKYEDLVTISTGKGLKRDEFIGNGEFPVIGANGELGRTDNYLFDEKLILTGRVGTLGTVYLIRDKIWISDNVLISKPISEEKYYYAYFTIRAFDFKSLNRGSTQPLVTQTDLKNQKVIIPNKIILTLFHKTCSELFNRLYHSNINITNLSQIRDSLLPRLMSGKIRVPVEVN